VHRPKKTKIKIIFKNMGQKRYSEATLIHIFFIIR
jgi:hypothetical protein